MVLQALTQDGKVKRVSPQALENSNQTVSLCLSLLGFSRFGVRLRL